MILSEVPSGKHAEIVALNLSEESVTRLTSLGLVPGVRIRVISNSIPRTSVIECLGTRLALGRGLPDLVEVRV